MVLGGQLPGRVDGRRNPISFFMSNLLWWVWRSWLARQIVALEAQGSNPCIHPVAVATIIVGLSPSGKAQDFDSCIRWFESN